MFLTNFTSRNNKKLTGLLNQSRDATREQGYPAKSRRPNNHIADGEYTV